MKNSKKIIVLMLSLFLMTKIYSTDREKIVSALFKSIEQWMGTPYLLGGTTNKGVDCSAFVGDVYRKVFKINLPRSVAQQMNVGKIVKNNFQPGDLIFFLIHGKISHVGIYVFDNKFIHAASAGPHTGVVKSSLNEPYYKKHFVFARRIVDLPSYTPKEKLNIVQNTNTNSNPYYNKRVKKKVAINNADVNFGRVFFRGELHDIREDYYQDESIYFKVTVKSEEKTNLFLVLQDKNIITNIKKIAIVADPIKDNYFVIKLKKGSYTVLLQDAQNRLFSTKSLIIQ